MNTNYTSDKILAVVGPTASGKSEMAVQLAKKFNGEIISCDSRQIYKGMDIGTGKVAGKWKKIAVALLNGRTKNEQFVYKGIVHHCIDYRDPKKQYSVSLFQKDAQKALQEIRSRGKLLILCGGTGQWIDAVLLEKKLPEVKPNLKLRKELEKLSTEELYQKLRLLDPDRAAVIDWHNPRRLIRALEIVITTGKPVPPLPTNHYPLPTLLIGLYPGQDELYKKIGKRLTERLKLGMIKEVQKLHRQGLSWKKLKSFGLEYKYISLFLEKKITKEQMVEQLSFAIKHYARRQMTWFRKNESVCWVNSLNDAKKLANDFLR
jgi:tRNA dimethylallyltransferase